MTIHDKYRVLQENLKALGSVAVAFSSGVDSTFLLKAAQEALGDKVIAVTASSCSFPKRELEEAKQLYNYEEIKESMSNDSTDSYNWEYYNDGLDIDQQDERFWNF